MPWKKTANREVICPDCGCSFVTAAPNAKRCPDCRTIHHRQIARESARRHTKGGSARFVTPPSRYPNGQRGYTTATDAKGPPKREDDATEKMHHRTQTEIVHAPYAVNPSLQPTEQSTAHGDAGRDRKTEGRRRD